MSTFEELTKRTNNLFLEYQKRMTYDIKYRNSEIARYKLLDNTILELPFESQVSQADMVTYGMITNSTQEDLLAWATGQYHIYTIDLKEGVANSTAVCNIACICGYLDNAEWSKLYAELHKKMFDMLKTQIQNNK
jgi:hypothetical protein